MAEELTQLEQDLVTHIEVYGMSVTRAAALLEINNPQHLLNKPRVQMAREAARRQLQAKTKITKETVTNGIQEAIEQAKLLGDPMAQIRGWSEIGKLHDLYGPTKVTVQLRGAMDEMRRELQAMPDDELLQLASDAADVIDADFYRVNDDGSA